jgi:serine/threonine protein kinase
LREDGLLICLPRMVWPPPKIEAPREGEAPPEAAARPASIPPTPSDPPSTQRDSSSPPSLSSPLPADWFERPERLIGVVLGNRYRITAVIGRGPLGIACEGESSRGRQVTLKLLPRPRDLPVEHFAWRVRQSFAMAHFDHANVAPVTDFGTLDDGNAFISRSRVPGVTLRSMLSQGALPLARSLAIARQIAAAIAAAHAQDIAHGRLEPENIIIQAGTPSGDVVRIVDFGMAGLASEHAPNPASDVFALAQLLFEMLAGQPPFPPNQIGAASAQPLSFAECRPVAEVPAAVSELVLGWLRPRGSEPLPSAVQVGHLLENVLGRPSTSKGPTPPPLEPVTSQVATRAASQASPSLPPPFPTSTVEPPSNAPQSTPSSIPAAPSGSRPPPLPPSMMRPAIAPRAQGSTPPVGVASGTYPPLPPGFGPSFPPPQVSAPSSSYPSLPNSPLSPSFPPSPSAAPSAPPDDGDMEADFRPSLIGRLRRLFVKKSDGGF